MNTHPDFPDYIQSITTILVRVHSYNSCEAKFVAEGFTPVIERIGTFDNPKDWADKLDQAMKLNITPEMWLSVLPPFLHL